MKKFLLFLIAIYQKISSLTPPRCRFYPTCSEYTKQAIIKYGIIKGSSDSGLNFGLMISNEKNVDEFDKCLKDYLSVFKGTEAENGN